MIFGALVATGAVCRALSEGYPRRSDLVWYDVSHSWRLVAALGLFSYDGP